MKNINLKSIRIDGDTQSRVGIHDDTVSDYAEVIREGGKLPPVVVFFDGSDHWLADGFHRLHAYRAAGKASIPADVREGMRSDAALFAAGANATHGQRRTNADKRRAVEMVLANPKAAGWSDRQIADHCGVGHPFVAAVRSPEVAAKQKAAKAPGVESDSITPSQKEAPQPAQAPSKAAAKPEVATAEDDRLAESRQAIVELSEEVEDLRAKLSVEQMDASEGEKTAAADLIADLRSQVKTLEAELKQMRISRDTFQAEVRELQKQINMNKRELQKARAAA